MHSKTCKTCLREFETSISHTVFCCRLCHRRDPINKIKYVERVKIYQNAHATEPKRRHQKLFFKAKLEQREMSIQYEDYFNLIQKPCFYCSASLLKETGSSLDRLDNKEGYMLQNVVQCCGACNQIRNVHLSHDEMKVAMMAVIEFRKKMLGEQ